MDSHLYFPDSFGAFIHAPVPVNSQAFDIDAFNVQESDISCDTHAQVYATFPQTQAPIPTTAVVTFPTPSELMVDLASNQDMNHYNSNMVNHHVGPLLEDFGFIQAASAPHTGTMQMDEMRMALGMIGIGDAQPNDGVGVGAPGPMMIRPHHIHPGVVTVEPTRRTRRRTTASGTHGSTFVPTDPDTISSHEKKRHYLECIEQYIQYLHEQFELLGERPPEMENVGSYRGLSSRSIRTLLVHMEHNTRKLSERTRDEEQRFVSLRNEVQSQTI